MLPVLLHLIIINDLYTRIAPYNIYEQCVEKNLYKRPLYRKIAMGFYGKYSEKGDAIQLY